MDLTGKRVLVTGASRGIGAALARDLGRRGAHVLLNARDAAALEAVAGEIRAAGGAATVLAGDVTVAAERARVLDAAGEIDVLVNNAGLEVAVALVDQTEDEVERQVALDLTAPIQLTRAVLPAMIARGRGAIVMISSMSGKAPIPWNSVYAAAKYGLVGLAASLRIELLGTGVHVGAVCPGFVAGEGMWSETGLRAPAALREVSVADVIAAVYAVIGGAGEVLVTRAPVRPLLALATLFPALEARALGWMGVTDALKARAAVVASKRGS